MAANARLIPRRRRPTLALDESPCVLVIDETAATDWQRAFRGKTAWNGQRVRVEQTSWSAITSSSSLASRGVQLELGPGPGLAGHHRTVSPHLVVVRSFARGPKGEEYINHLHVFLHGGVPCINGVESLLAFYERTNAIACMQRVEERINDLAVFCAVPTDLYSNVGELHFRPQFPLVAKVGSSHAGTGKMRFVEGASFDDFRSLVSASRQYVTLEPFLDRDYEYRLQRMGAQVRAYTRASVTHDWKANQGEGRVEDMPVTAEHWRIVEAVDALYPHFDVWGVDLLVTKSGRTFALEINDSAIGFNDNHAAEDLAALVDVVLSRLQVEYAAQ